ncbi:Sodium-dependent neutral amino acid transporter SLC6A17 [Pseudolycoriella hygida]|uniref:Sodium-dependent neutral amino acid transporter SLC6A17 n=1 Tax=Pseudolycoriella hygida TaxID=35572 RepID=A0A9Q0S8B9_9DIPT|nr:Sodium-dependent neutral amino acid transporter SLC6A17 [Pseudolycoriella hygida]
MGAFLIPFMLMLVLEGIPLFLIELGMGQKMRLGSLGVWNTSKSKIICNITELIQVHPWLGGIGISSCIVTLFVALYYNVIITWCVYYFVNSFRVELPWSKCPTYANGTNYKECQSPTTYFWYRTTLDIAPSIDEPGGLKWWIVLCLFISWLVVFFIVMKGIQSSGKVVYFTSLFPYIVLTIFFIRGITLDGAGAGLLHMYKPQMEKLLDATVWLDAATQVFYSFGLAFGSLIAFGSYNTPKNNCVRDVLLVSVCNAFTAIYASIVIFAILGFKATNDLERCIDKNINILIQHQLLPPVNVTRSEYEKVYESSLLVPGKAEILKWGVSDNCTLEKQLGSAAEGTGLAFIVFTQAIVELPGAPFWSVLFFTMLLSLGLGSQIGILEGMLCTLFDIDIMKRLRKQYVTAFVCAFCFIVGLIFCTGAGEYWLKLFDSFAGTIGLVVIALMESIAVIYVYGHERFTDDVYQMTGIRPGAYWQYTWRYVGPIIMSLILLASVIKMVVNNPEYSAWIAEEAKTESVPYPNWVLGIALAMITAGVLPMPIVFCLRRFQILKVDLDIHQGSIRRNETTASTKVMMDDDDLYSPDMPPENSLSATRFTIGDFDDDDDDDFSGPAIGGPIGVRSDSDDEDEPPTMGNIRSQFRSSLSAPNKKPFSMEVIDF